MKRKGKGEKEKGKQKRREEGKERKSRKGGGEKEEGKRRGKGRKEMGRKGKRKEKRKGKGTGQRKALESPAAHPLALLGASRCLSAPVFPEHAAPALHPKPLGSSWPGLGKPLERLQGDRKALEAELPTRQRSQNISRSRKWLECSLQRLGKEHTPRRAHGSEPSCPPGLPSLRRLLESSTSLENPGRMDTIRGVPRGYC